MSIVRPSELHRLPLSPLSDKSALGSPQDSYTQDHTQYPTSIRDNLYERGIDATELNLKYNRLTVPIMDDEQFYEILLDIAGRREHDKSDMESDLKRKLQELTNPLLDDYNAAKFELGMMGVDCIEPSHTFAAFLRQNTVNGRQRFIADCLPSIIEVCGNDKRRRQKRTHTGRCHHPETRISITPPQAPRRVTRRSNRISRAQPRRSDRIRAQPRRTLDVQ